MNEKKIRHEFADIVGETASLARVMTALGKTNLEFEESWITDNTYCFFGSGSNWEEIQWQLLNPDGSECTADDQSIEVLEKLLKLLTN